MLLHAPRIARCLRGCFSAVDNRLLEFVSHGWIPKEEMCFSICELPDRFSIRRSKNRFSHEFARCINLIFWGAVRWSHRSLSVDHNSDKPCADGSGHLGSVRCAWCKNGDNHTVDIRCRAIDETDLENSSALSPLQFREALPQPVHRRDYVQIEKCDTLDRCSHSRSN
jgi:hypothetical protein